MVIGKVCMLLPRHSAALLVLAGALSACAPAPDPTDGATASAARAAASRAPSPGATEEKMLNFSNWSDYMPAGMLEDFERETGIKVNYRNYGSNEDLQKIVSLKTDSDDLVVPSLSYGKTQMTQGYYRALDKSLLLNYKNLDPAFMKNMETSDPGNRYFIPWAWGHTTIFINKTRVRKALGDLAYPDNELDLVFNPSYTSRLKSCGIAYVDSPSEIIPLALHYLGIDPYTTDTKNFHKAVEMLKRVRKDIGTFNAKIIDVLSSDKVCVGIGWSGDINTAIGTLKSAGNTSELVGALPRDGTLMFVDALSIPVNAKHPNNAHAFIDFYLRAKNSARMANEVGYPNGNQAALEFVQKDIKNNPLIYPPAEFFSKLVPSDGYTKAARWDMMQGYIDFAFKVGSH